jgi:hypothetical protein
MFVLALPTSDKKPPNLTVRGFRVRGKGGAVDGPAEVLPGAGQLMGLGAYVASRAGRKEVV